MVVLERIYKIELPVYVKLAFEGDEELLNDLHISPGSLDHCVNHTLGLVNGSADFYKDDIEYFKVSLNDETIGYTIVIKNETRPNELYSFGINIKYRTKEILQSWLTEVEKILSKPYYIVLWSKNTRAINFFERNGFVVDGKNKILNDETKTLIICPQAARFLAQEQDCS